MAPCHIATLKSWCLFCRFTGHWFFTNRRTVEMVESVGESFFSVLPRGNISEVQVAGIKRLKVMMISWWILGSCIILSINSAGYFEVPGVSIPCYTCPTISHPKPNYPYDFTVDQVVQQLSLVETMLRKKRYVRWCGLKKIIHKKHHVMWWYQMRISLLTWCDPCFVW